MKPIRLEIDGINSYASKQVIDFETLTSRGIFGIFGKTGSGKSTILDAMTLALYGNIARGTKEFINSNRDKASIFYTFELGLGSDRARYMVTRRFKKKEKSGKTSAVSDYVRLMSMDASGEYEVLADKVGEVNSQIKSILGLEESDFLKSVVLPQGRFGEFLSLTGKDRRNMLERIFNLEEYGTDLNISLARNKKSVNDQINIVQAKLAEYPDVTAQAYKDLEENIKDVNNELASSKNSLTEADKLYEEYREVYKLMSDKAKLDLIEKNLSSQREEMEFLRSRLETSRTYFGLEADIKKIEDLDAQLVKINQELNLADKNKKKLDQKTNLIESEIKELKNKLSKFKNLDDISDLQNKYKVKKEELDIFDKNEIEKSLEKDRLYVIEEEKRIKILNEKIKDLENKRSSSSSLILNYESDLKISKEKIIKESQIFDEKVKENFKDVGEFLKYLDLSDSLIGQKEKIDQYFEKLNNISIRIESLKVYENIDLYQTDKLREEIENLKEKIEKTNDFLFSIRLKVEKLSESKKEINKIKISLDKSKNDDEILYKLAKVCDGSLSKVSGREKINFETFVLSYYFNKILTYANLRLKDMSDGQFKMLRKKETSDKRKNNGLDIEILDYNTGKIRSEASLSGGETFIASLALALGLSDEISGENGGIKIDTLFIDEGFGSLSDDCLEKAIRTIEKLSYDNKFIGLISHVKELKNAIDAKIEVKYSKTEGSSLKVVV